MVAGSEFDREAYLDLQRVALVRPVSLLQMFRAELSAGRGPLYYVDCPASSGPFNYHGATGWPASRFFDRHTAEQVAVLCEEAYTLGRARLAAEVCNLLGVKQER